MRFLCAALALTSLCACTVETTTHGFEPEPANRPSVHTPAAIPSSPPASSSLPPQAPASPRATVTPNEHGFAEVVYVFMRDRKNSLWFCTGTLVSATTVVTAGHCLEEAKFVSYEIVAPMAANRPRITASKANQLSAEFANVAVPDIGFLTLSKPVALSVYAELTDVTARVDAGEQLSVAAVVRTAEKPEAPLQESDVMPLSSTVELGYAHGFGTPLFSKGGDSGAGLFLVEEGKRTHKLVAVARQPEPAREMDHFTRIDATFLSWYAERAGRTTR